MMGDVNAATRTVWDPVLTDIYERRFLDLVRLAYLMTGVRAVAEEITQDAFISVHARWAAVTNPEPYLRQAVLNACRSWFRRRALEDRHRPDRPQDAALGADELWDALNRLPYRRRAAIVLRFYEDLPDTEIAEVLGCRPTTVRTTIHRALADLRREIEP